MIFSGFEKGDFAVFEQRKQSDANYNDRRRLVRDKMKSVEAILTPMLESTGIVLNAKVSLSGLNPIYKPSINGIWIAYTSELSRYFEMPQLNCGIYEKTFFVGIEIPRKNRTAQLSFVEMCIKRAVLLNQIEKKLKTGPYELEVYLHGTETETINHLVKVLASTPHWVSIGVDIPPESSDLRSQNLCRFLFSVLEMLYPVYLYISGIKTMKDVKRIGGVQERTLESALKTVLDVSGGLKADREIADMIAKHDAKNAKISSKTRTSSSAYRRDIELSALVKYKRGDKCQLCGATHDLGGSFFCESHHIQPISEGGLDQSRNIIVVCPNHHKILDAKGAEVLKKTKHSVTIRLESEKFDLTI